MTVIKPAPKLTPRDPAPGMARLVAWQLYRTNEQITGLERDLTRERTRVDGLQQQIASLRVTGGPSHPAAKRVADIIHAAEKKARAEQLWSGLDDTAIVDAIVDAAATRHAAEGIRRRIERLASQVEGMLKPFDGVKSDLARAVRLANEAI